MATDGDAADMTSAPRYNTEAEIDEVILRLDLTLVRPDDDVSRQHQLSTEPTSARAAPDNKGVSTTCDVTNNDKTDAAAKMVKSQVTNTSSSSQLADDDKKKSKPLDFIRKLRQTDSHQRGNAAASDAGNKRKSPEPLKVGRSQRYVLNSQLYSLKTGQDWQPNYEAGDCH